MAQVGVPRFYISWGDWWRSMGITVPRFQTISPTETISVQLSSTGDWFIFPYVEGEADAALVPGSYPVGINWVGVLNHNLSPPY